MYNMSPIQLLPENLAKLTNLTFTRPSSSTDDNDDNVNEGGEEERKQLRTYLRTHQSIW